MAASDSPEEPVAPDWRSLALSAVCEIELMSRTESDLASKANFQARRDALLAAEDEQPRWTDEWYQDWLNDLMENAPEDWDGDEAMESLVTGYVHHLEAEVKRLGGSANRYPSEDEQPATNGTV